MAIASQTVVCQLDELHDPDCRGLTLCLNEQIFDVFIVRRGMQVFAYHNSCPHTGGPLDWVSGQFLNIDRDYIQCATHDALFRLNDGYCVAGPCAGDKLKSVPVVIDTGKVMIVHEELLADSC